MDIATILPITTPGAIIVSALAVLALRHKSWRGVLAALGVLLVFAIMLQIPSARDTQDMFILWRLMFFVLSGAINLVLMGTAIAFGAMIGAVVVLMDVAITRSRQPLPIWFTGPVCIALGLAAGLALLADPPPNPVANAPYKLSIPAQ